MIYLDSAATSYQKPRDVIRAVQQAFLRCSSPGRGAYASAAAAADLLFDARLMAAELFHVPQPEQVVFTTSATHGLNIALRSLIRPGDRVVISGYEHNAVTRPLKALGANVSVVRSPLFQPDRMAEEFSRALTGAKAAVCTHVSNVFGYILPIGSIAAACRSAGVPLIVDASQSAGILPVDFKALGAEFIAMPGHKGLLGPQGTGLLLCGSEGVPLISGGTGSDSMRSEMPDFLPDRLEAGTHNVPGIAGLLAGMRWLKRQRPGKVLAYEQMLMKKFLEKIIDFPGLRIYTSPVPDCQSAVLSLQSARLDCEDLARLLGERGIAVRAGLHCAPLAHSSAGTLEKGTVRFSFSSFNTVQEVTRSAEILMGLTG